MNKTATPIDIARQTLMQLATRKTPPTPDNFRSVYDEIAGEKSEDQSLMLGQTLEKVLRDLGEKSPKYIMAAQTISPVIQKREWGKLEEQLKKLFPAASTDGGAVNWSVLIRTLIKQLETGHKGITLSRKKEGLSKVLTNFANDPETMGQKIQALISAWGEGGASGAVEDGVPAIAGEVAGGAAELASPKSSPPSILPGSKAGEQQWRDLLAKTMDLVVIPALENHPQLANKAKQLPAMILAARQEAEIQRCASELKHLLIALEIQTDQEKRIHESLLQLLRLMAGSLSELAIDERWLHGQASVLQEILSKPLNINTLYDAESSFKELVYKQSQIRPAMTEARETLKQMASTFVDRLVEMTESTSDYHDKIEGYQHKISATEDIGELNRLLKSVLEDTRAIGLSVQRTRDEFHQSQRKAIEAEKKIQELTAELDKISEMAHQDYLTGALNRRGMDEALEREFNRAERHGTTLSIAMMDIDHFKRLNDSLGHASGDEALAHFAKVIREVMRTTDVLARYGGEEFMIILPDTGQEESVSVVTRVQRELTRNFFLHQNERVLITFSAGVAERKPGETPEDLIPRADAALYQAKHTGRNRVLAAETTLEGTATASQ